MKITDCIGCGNCQDFIESKSCPTDSIFMDKYKGYANAVINQKKCNNCGKCKAEIQCLNDCFEDGEK